MGGHLRSGHTRKLPNRKRSSNKSNKSSRKSKRLGTALSIQQVGGRPAGRLNSTPMFRVGGGLFTSKEIVRARERFGQSRGVRPRM